MSDSKDTLATFLDIAAIHKRADAATPGPWQQSYYVPPRGDRRHPDDQQRIDLEERRIIRGAGTVGEPSCNQLFRLEGLEATQANAAFIAHAREDVPALCDEIERLRAIESRAKQTLDPHAESGPQPSRTCQLVIEWVLNGK